MKQFILAKESTNLTDPDLQFKAARTKIILAKAKNIDEAEALKHRKLKATTEISEYHAKHRGETIPWNTAALHADCGRSAGSFGPLRC